MVPIDNHSTSEELGRNKDSFPTLESTSIEEVFRYVVALRKIGWAPSPEILVTTIERLDPFSDRLGILLCLKRDFDQKDKLGQFEEIIGDGSEETAWHVRNSVSSIINDGIRSVLAEPLLELHKKIEQKLSNPATITAKDIEASRSLIDDFFSNHKVCNSDFGRIEVTSKALTSEEFLRSQDPWRLDLAVDVEGKRWSTNTHNVLREIWKLYRVAEFELKITESPLKFDQARHESLREEYGAKGAALVFLREAASWIRDTLRLPLYVPEFQLVPTSVYKSWKQGDDISEALRPFYNWSSSDHAIVRSSARFSEDGEELTGAGVYSSERLKKGASFEEFVEAVKSVYHSVDSELAVKYRTDASIGNEEMGLVVQRFVCDQFGNSYSGHVDTVRAKVPELLDIRNPNGERITCHKSKLVELVACGDSISQGGVRFVESESHHSFREFDLKIGTAAYVVERLCGRPQQVEFVFHNQFFIAVQTRPLPSQYLGKANIHFLVDMEPVFEGSGLGICDLELDILGKDDSNSGKEGVVIFHRSHGAGHFGPERYFPKKGVVAILAQSASGDGHIETRAIERGLMLVFNPESATLKNTKMLSALLEGHHLEDGLGVEVIPHIQGHRRVRVVSDGLTAKIYLVGKK